MKMTNSKFEALEARQKELEKELNTPVFIEIKTARLYKVEENGDVTYIN